jgi:hypothetical protein
MDNSEPEELDIVSSKVDLEAMTLVKPRAFSVANVDRLHGTLCQSGLNMTIRTYAF